MEVQQEVRSLKDRLGLVAGHVDVLRRGLGRGFVAARDVQDDVPAQPILFHARAERGQRGGFLFRVALGAETFQPVHLASELPEAERVLQVHPEVPAAFGEICDIEWGDNHGRHELLLCRRADHKLCEVLITDELNGLSGQRLADAWIAQRAQLGFALS